MTQTQPISAALRQGAPLSPAPIFDTLTRYQQTMALKGAIDLDLFTHIASGAHTAAALARECRAAERGVRILCDFLAIHGYLRKQGADYSLSPEASLFLDRHSPAYIGEVARFLTHPAKMNNFRDVAAVVRNGGTTQPGCCDSPDAGEWVEFARSMASLSRIVAQAAASALSEPGRAIKVLDLAASHGIFGLTIAQRNPAAEIYACDFPEVLAVGQENAERSGVASRFHLIPGSAFDVPLGEDYDLVLAPNFLHMFGPTRIGELLVRVHAALKPGGRLATIEFVPNPDRISPPEPASFALIMLANTAEGDAYTFAEFDAMFRRAGFGESRQLPLPPSPASLILTGR